MKIRSLEDCSTEAVYQAFLSAFSDYEHPMQMTLENYQEMMKTRDLNLGYSIGAFEAEQLVGFIVCGYRELDGEKLCYDGGTGVIRDYRRQGISNTLLQELIPHFRNRGIDHFILEVLENNSPAISLYEKNGFKITRRFRCYECPAELIPPPAIHGYDRDDQIDSFKTLATSEYLTFKPSWQNHRQSVENVIADHAYVSLTSQGHVIAFGLVHRRTGNIPQLGVATPWRGKGLEAHIISALSEKTASRRLIVLNVEDKDALIEPLERIGFTNFTNQYEMVLDLKG